MRLGLGSLVGLAPLLVAASTETPARAAPAEIAVSIDCPALDANARALLEARVRAELASESLTDGALAIRCSDSSATLVWQPTGGARRERTTPLAADPASAVDPLLEEIHALSTAPAPAAAPAAPIGAPEPARDAAPPPARPARSWLGVTVGADSELWSGSIPGAVGAHAGARFALGRRWAVHVLGGPAWGVGTVDGLRAWRLRGLARLEYAPVAALELGLGASARVLWAQAASGVSPSGRTGATVGALASAHFALAAGPVSISAGPELEALVAPVPVDFAGAEVFRLPSWVVGLSLDATTR